MGKEHGIVLKMKWTIAIFNKVAEDQERKSNTKK